MRRVGIITGFIAGTIAFVIIRNTKAAAPVTVNVSFSPSSISITQNVPQSTTIDIDSSTAKVGYIHLVLNFDQNIVKLNSDINLASPLGKLISVTPATTANETGRVDIILGLDPADLNNPPTGSFQIGTMTFAPATTATNQQVNVTLNSNLSQIVTLDDQSDIIAPSDLTVNVNTVNSTPTPIATPSGPTSSPVSSPSPSPTPTVTPTPPAGFGLTGNYFNGNDFQNFVLKRIDPNINFNWQLGSPDSQINDDYFSVDWTGFFYASKSGRYIFYTRSDDGVRFYINNNLLINDWNHHPVKENYGKVYLKGGQEYPVKLEYFENTYHAEIQLLYRGPNSIKQTVPSELLLP